MRITVLYIHPIGIFGGASRSLFELLKAFPCGCIHPYVVAQQGQVASILERENISVIRTYGLTQFDNTLFSYYRGLRWLVLLRELVFLLPTFIALREAKRQWKTVDIIHVNELTAMPSAIIAKFYFKVPIVMHVRSLQRPMTNGLRGKLLKYLIHRYVDQLVAIDCTVRASLPMDLSVEIVRNGFPPPDELVVSSEQRPIREFSPNRPLRVGCVGGLLKFKGVYELVEAARLCIQAGLSVEFVLVGENPRKLRGIRGYLLRRFGFASDIRSELESMVDNYALNKNVKFKGFTSDIRAVYESIDVLCFPSHLNACGRPVFEAAFSRVPSIVAVDAPLEDTIINGQTGICISAKNPAAISDAVKFFYSHPEELERMGDAAYQLAVKNFDIAENAAKMVDIYKNLISKIAL